MDQKIVEEVKDFLLGTSNADYDATNAFDLTDEQTQEAIIEAEIECCDTCGWWYESHEVKEVDGELVCNDCLDVNDDE